MTDYILLMHGDTRTPTDEADWAAYFAQLAADGAFAGGSSIGDGRCFRREGTPGPVASHLTGYIRIVARNREEAERCLIGNPVYENGGTVEIRALPRD